jgi:two-component system, chemotaxis family, sensor kinase CheA
MELADQELLTDFVVESQEGLANIEQQLLAIETAGANIDTNLVNAVFRTMHSIKGAAGFLGLDRVETLAHGLEEVLNNLRNREVIPTSELVSCVLNGADFMKNLIDAIESSNEADVSAYVEALHAFRPDAVAEITSALLATVDQCRDGLERVEKQGNDDGFDPTALVDLLTKLSTVGENAMPSQSAPAHVSKNSDTISVAPTPKSAIAAPTAVIVTPVAKAATTTTPSDVTPSLAAPPVSNETATAEKNASNAGDSTIRVDVALLDKLMTRVGELVLARNQIVQHANGLDDANLVKSAQRLNLITTELQESVMKTRMQPIGNVWSKFPRVVRDLSSLLGKQVRIEMEGKETELDKTIVEAIKDPLTHVVRNSVDHGIETPEKRTSLGKPAEGVLSLRAYHEGGQVNIEISDDGAGLNLERIRKKAIERGLINAEQAARMSDRDAMQLVLLPGFSTAEQVTSVSGRGVGMDVVKTNIERIGGTLDIQSQAGQGTTVLIKIPLTLAIIPALIVTSGEDRYAIPQVSLLELVRLEGEGAEQGIEEVHGAPVYRLRGKLLPLVHLAECLHRTANEANACENSNKAAIEKDAAVNIIVLRANDQQFGLVVDRVIDTEEIVVKPLSRQLKSISEYAGATIMGDGTVALILDVMGVAHASGLASQMREQNAASSNSQETRSAHDSQTLLVVDLGDARRFALPTSMVSRLEKVPLDSIELADGREVIQYRQNILPLVRLSNVFGASHLTEQSSTELQIIVYADQGLACGFVVNRIVDIVETELRFQSAKSAADILLGTTVIQQHVTDVLNLRNIAQRELCL